MEVQVPLQKMPVSFGMLGQWKSCACPKTGEGVFKSNRGGFRLTFLFPWPCMLAPVNPFPVTGRSRDGTHACSSPSFSQNRIWDEEPKIKCCVHPVQSFWLFQINTWKIFIISLTLPFASLYGNQGPVSIQLRGQCCPLTFIASLSNSWMGDKSD